MTFVPSAYFMRLAIEKAREGVPKGQYPYGACVVKVDEMVSCAHNVTRATMDPAAHAEIEALRQACLKLKTLDLTGCVVYATCEPCSMCFTACHNARLSTIVYGVSLADSANATGRRSLAVASARMKDLLDSPIQIIGGFLREEALRLFNA